GAPSCADRIGSRGIGLTSSPAVTLGRTTASRADRTCLPRAAVSSESGSAPAADQGADERTRWGPSQASPRRSRRGGAFSVLGARFEVSFRHRDGLADDPAAGGGSHDHAGLAGPQALHPTDRERRQLSSSLEYSRPRVQAVSGPRSWTA